MAIPILLTSAQAITEEIERLEIHHLASPEGELHFALLADWIDAEAVHVPRATMSCWLSRPPASGG